MPILIYLVTMESSRKAVWPKTWTVSSASHMEMIILILQKPGYAPGYKFQFYFMVKQKDGRIIL
jgi:isopentenyldiphosphate isomerase